jgi:hypothetical protein
MDVGLQLIWKGMVEIRMAEASSATTNCGKIGAFGPPQELPNKRQVKRRKDEFRQKERGRQRDAQVR